MTALRLLALLIAAASLAACSDAADDATGAATSASATVATESLASGIDLTGIDPEVRPQDDFFRHVNGGWLERTTIPEDRSSYGSFTVLADEAQVASREIIETAAEADADADPIAAKVGAFYRAFMDEETVESRGIAPLEPGFEAIDGLASHEDVIRYIGEMQRGTVRTPIGFYVYPDFGDTSRYAVYLTQSGLGLPNRDYYDKDGFAAKKAAYETYVADLLALAGFEDTANAAAAILALESRIAAAHWTPVENRDRVATYNPLSVAELEDAADDFDWKSFLEAAGLAERIDDVVVRQPSYAQALGAIVRETPVTVWQDYFRFHLLDASAPYLSADFVDRAFAFRGTELSGIAENRPRWKRAVSATTRVLGEAVGELYVAQHFPPEAKTRMEELVGNLRSAFSEGIDGLEWMSAETKVEAHRKLERFVAKIGYPEEWRDYSSLEVAGDTLFENMQAATRFEYERQVGKLGGPIDRGEWGMTPMTVNAYYSPGLNEIVFPAAILQPPFFDLEADDAVNYGGIGAVIGHEISHGFDDQGRKTDGAGMLRDWWTEADARAFELRAARLGRQFDGYCPFEDACVQGAFTMGENIGDLS
ncbi:MAG: M13 family metallopeptidase, partial [Pseudomonadales bacterium]|nr:M13 family metallopeptidase [Pseudomonadales bacterium]